MKRMLIAVLAGVTGCASGGGQSGTQQAPVRPTPEVVTSEELRRDLFAFADDSMRGRETGTPDATRAAAFIASRLAPAWAGARRGQWLLPARTNATR